MLTYMRVEMVSRQFSYGRPRHDVNFDCCFFFSFGRFAFCIVAVVGVFCVSFICAFSMFVFQLKSCTVSDTKERLRVTAKKNVNVCDAATKNKKRNNNTVIYTSTYTNFISSKNTTAIECMTILLVLSLALCRYRFCRFAYG